MSIYMNVKRECVVYAKNLLPWVAEKVYILITIILQMKFEVFFVQIVTLVLGNLKTQ